LIDRRLGAERRLAVDLIDFRLGAERRLGDFRFDADRLLDADIVIYTLFK
jgi:hypothetical protein